MANQEYFAGSATFPPHPQGPPPPYEQVQRPQPQTALSYPQAPPQQKPWQHLYGGPHHPSQHYYQPLQPYAQPPQQRPPPQAQVQQPHGQAPQQPPLRPSHSPRPSHSDSYSSDEHRRKHKHHKKRRGKKYQNSDSFLGAAGGAMLGDLLIAPGVGTLGGAIVGALGGQKHHETRDKSRSRSRDPR